VRNVKQDVSINVNNISLCVQASFILDVQGIIIERCIIVKDLGFDLRFAFGQFEISKKIGMCVRVCVCACVCVCLQVKERDANVNVQHLSLSDTSQSVSNDDWQQTAVCLSPQPVITLTDMTDSSVLQARGRPRQQLLFSEDFDAIQDYLLNCDSPMVNLSPSWLCKGSGDSSPAVHVFPPAVTAVSHSSLAAAGLASPQIIASQPAVTVSSTIDMSSNTESSLLHGHEVCVCACGLRLH